MRFFHYFLKELETGKEVHITTSTFLGDVNEKVTYDDTDYIIEDWIDEYEDFEEPEDFDLEARYVAYCGGYND